jgi:gas vesicle protein
MHHHDEYNNQAGSKLGIGLLGIGLGALLGLALSPRSGRRNRMMAKNWMHRMDRDLNRRLNETRDLTQSKYEQIVDDLNYRYGKARDIKTSELDDFTKDLKNRWERIKDRWNDRSRDEDNY